MMTHFHSIPHQNELKMMTLLLTPVEKVFKTESSWLVKDTCSVVG